MHSEYISGEENAFWMIFTAHVIGWIAQFIGHGVFEGRKPALMDNLLQGKFMSQVISDLPVNGLG